MTPSDLEAVSGRLMAQNSRSDTHRLSRNSVAAVLRRPGILRDWRNTTIVSPLPAAETALNDALYGRSDTAFTISFTGGETEYIRAMNYHQCEK